MIWTSKNGKQTEIAHLADTHLTNILEKYDKSEIDPDIYAELLKEYKDRGLNMEIIL